MNPRGVRRRTTLSSHFLFLSLSLSLSLDVRARARVCVCVCVWLGTQKPPNERVCVRVSDIRTCMDGDSYALVIIHSHTDRTHSHFSSFICIFVSILPIVNIIHIHTLNQWGRRCRIGCARPSSTHTVPSCSTEPSFSQILGLAHLGFRCALDRY